MTFSSRRRVPELGLLHSPKSLKVTVKRLDLSRIIQNDVNPSSGVVSACSRQRSMPHPGNGGTYILDDSAPKQSGPIWNKQTDVHGLRVIDIRTAHGSVHNSNMHHYTCPLETPTIGRGTRAFVVLATQLLIDLCTMSPPCMLRTSQQDLWASYLLQVDVFTPETKRTCGEPIRLHTNRYSRTHLC